MQAGSQTNLEGRALPTLSPGKGSLAIVVRTYKAAVTTLARRSHLADAIWQRNYFEHVIRDEEDLRRIREYIAHNPLSWEIGEENPGRS
jgi:putative transposase